jgi:hypothetical protein
LADSGLGGKVMDPKPILTRTEEIPQKRWPQFFDAFSRRHEGWRVDVEVLMGEQGAQYEVSDLPFFGASAVLEDSPTVTIELGGRETDNIEHRIGDVRRVWVETLVDGREAGLDIESEGGRKTLVVFRAPQPVEAVDGMALPQSGHRRHPGRP